VFVGVIVLVGVFVGVCVAVGVIDEVIVGVIVFVGVTVGVSVDVGVGVGLNGITQSILTDQLVRIIGDSTTTNTSLGIADVLLNCKEPELLPVTGGYPKFISC
jgi:hypothetical protein